jgi:uncharacterized membrane protein YgdD (TMEM256/DUF423 family)
MNAQRVLGVAGLLLATGIVAGALAAHALKAVLQAAQLESLHTAVNYQLFNALGLLVVGVLLREAPAVAAKGLSWVAVLLIAGIVCFSGSIYALLAGGPRWLGPVTPLGGVLLIAAWLQFAVVMLRRIKPEQGQG